MTPFSNRADGGSQLAEQLLQYANRDDVVILALPRGGVVTGYQVAKQLNLPMDITCPKKIGAPGNPEYAIGAVTESGEGLFNDEVIDRLGIPDEELRAAVEDRQRLAQERLHIYRMGRPGINLTDKTVLIVDDGLATGFTMKAAIVSVRKQHPNKIVVAVPVSPPDTLRKIQDLVDEVICLQAPIYFQAVGQFYEEFFQTDDSEVIQLLQELHERS